MTCHRQGPIDPGQSGLRKRDSSLRNTFGSRASFFAPATIYNHKEAWVTILLGDCTLKQL
jgi:hypothetical protein